MHDRPPDLSQVTITSERKVTSLHSRGQLAVATAVILIAFLSSNGQSYNTMHLNGSPMTILFNRGWTLRDEHLIVRSIAIKSVNLYVF
jgi:hypothetical protein